MPAPSLETFTVLPSKKYNLAPQPEALPLHGLDLLFPPVQIRNHRFYRVKSLETEGDKLIERLKTTFAEALELMPPVNGVVRPDDKGTMVSAQDKTGTPFIVEKRDTPFTGEDESIVPRPGLFLPPLAPTVAVKVTLFSDGVVTVASSVHHNASDLVGFLGFLEIWAKLSRGETIDLATLHTDWTRDPSPYFPAPTLPIEPPPGFVVLPEPAPGPSPHLLAPSQLTVWTFPKSSLEKLKKDFYPSEPGLWISTGDALAALTAGAVTRARAAGKVARLPGRSSEEAGVEVLSNAGDIRERALKKNVKYFGMATSPALSTVKRADLESNTLEAGSRVAVAIRETLKEQLSKEWLANKLQWFGRTENNTPPGRVVWQADLLMTNWCHHDLLGPKYDLGLGEAFEATAGGGFFPPGYIMMLTAGEVSVVMTVEKEGVTALTEDSLLTQYGSLVSIDGEKVNK